MVWFYSLIFHHHFEWTVSWFLIFCSTSHQSRFSQLLQRLKNPRFSNKNLQFSISGNVFLNNWGAERRKKVDENVNMLKFLHWMTCNFYFLLHHIFLSGIEIFVLFECDVGWKFPWAFQNFSTDFDNLLNFLLRVIQGCREGLKVLWNPRQIWGLNRWKIQQFYSY